MPFPCPQVFEDIFSEYDFSRVPDRKSWKGRAKYGFERISGFFTRKDPVIIQIETIKNEIKSELKLIEKIKGQEVNDEKHQFDAWFELIFKLAEKAEIAQGLKYPSYILELFGIASESDKESLFCQTLHALRSYVIYKLGEKNDQCKKWYDEKIKLLHENADLCEKNLDYAATCDQGRNSDKLSMERENLALHRALLEHPKAIVDAKAYGLLKYLTTYDQMNLLITKKVPANEANLAAPFCLQKNFYLVLYKGEFQKNTNISFADFEAASIQKYILKQKENEKSEEEQNQANHATNTISTLGGMFSRQLDQTSSNEMQTHEEQPSPKI